MISRYRHDRTQNLARPAPSDRVERPYNSRQVIPSGSRVGPYEVATLIGQGGMGEAVPPM